MKDNFSQQATEYVRFRPKYPDEMLQFVVSRVSQPNEAWDVGTGNGQLAVWLADRFQQVFATDISQKQLDQAPQRDNIYYQLVAAEEDRFTENQFDLVTVGQALHWFNLRYFFPIVRHCLKPNGLIALLGYPFLRITPLIEAVIHHLYANILDGYWDDERKHVEQEYRSLPFPFSEIATPEFSYNTQWTLNQLFGYLNTWSAVQHYRRDNSRNPVDLIADDLVQAWGQKQQREVRFPMFLRLGRNRK